MLLVSKKLAIIHLKSLPRNVGFFAGTMLLVLVILTLVNEELLVADNIPLVITALGITISVCRALIPDDVSFYHIVVH